MAEKRYWLDEPRNVKKLVYGLYAVCAVLALADFFYQKHGEFHWEEIPTSFALFGFIAGTAIVLGAKELRKVIKRDEDYYDR